MNSSPLASLVTVRLARQVVKTNASDAHRFFVGEGKPLLPISTRKGGELFIDCQSRDPMPGTYT